jgi:hypothetical protein
MKLSTVAPLLMLFVSLSEAFAGIPLPRFAPGTPHYFDEFHPELTPWTPGPERNFEEVFKNYRYFELLFDEGGVVTVRHYQQGSLTETRRFRLEDDGSLQPIGENHPSATEGLYDTLCASCHGKHRLGGIGPALLPENLERLRPEAAADVIRDGRVATQMPAFGRQLTDAQLAGLVEHIYTPPAETVTWGEAEIEASRVVYQVGQAPAAAPVFDADPLNLTLVVEAGDHHITILDGDRLEPVHRFPTRFALHGGLKYSPDGRFVYMASRDGWVTKYDLYRLAPVAEIRVGINTRNVAVSGDGRYLLAGNYLPHSVVLLDARDLSLLRVIPAAGAAGGSSRVSAVYQAAPRGSFVVALKDIPEVWEIRHDGEGFPIHRIRLDRVLDDFLFDQDYRYVIGADRASDGGQVVELDTGTVVATLELSGMPHLGSGITWSYQGHPVMATPNLKKGEVDVIDMTSWRTIKRLKTLGPGFFMRSHENTPYAWVDVFFGENKDALHVINKDTLEIVATLRPERGKTSAHVEFTRDGRYALVSLWEMDGALIVYDARTLQEVKRIPMKKPSGKYNVFNKITRSAGTSH